MALERRRDSLLIAARRDHAATPRASSGSSATAVVPGTEVTSRDPLRSFPGSPASTGTQESRRGTAPGPQNRRTDDEPSRRTATGGAGRCRRKRRSPRSPPTDSGLTYPGLKKARSQEGQKMAQPICLTKRSIWTLTVYPAFSSGAQSPLWTILQSRVSPSELRRAATSPAPSTVTSFEHLSHVHTQGEFIVQYLISTAVVGRYRELRN